MSSNDRMLRLTMVIGFVILTTALGCVSDCISSADDVRGLQEILELCPVRCRYMGSDWTPNNNCMTFTFSIVATAAGKVGQDKKASQLERRQAMAMVSLAYLSCWHLSPSHIKSTLSSFAKKSKWIVEE